MWKSPDINEDDDVVMLFMWGVNANLRKKSWDPFSHPCISNSSTYFENVCQKKTARTVPVLYYYNLDEISNVQKVAVTKTLVF